MEQLFVIFLRVVDAVNPDRVDLTGRFATLGRIIDDDRKCGSAWVIVPFFREKSVFIMPEYYQEERGVASIYHQ